MTNYEALKRMEEEDIADLLMQFIICSKTAETNKRKIVEWLKGDSLFLPFSEGETE